MEGSPMPRSSGEGADPADSGSAGVSPGSLSGAVARATARIEEIISSAEVAAAAIRADAEAEAGSLLETKRQEADRLHHQRLDALKGHTRSLSQQLVGLRDTLDEAMGVIDRSVGAIEELAASPGPPSDPAPGISLPSTPRALRRRPARQERVPATPPADFPVAHADAAELEAPVIREAAAAHPIPPAPTTPPVSDALDTDQAMLRATQMAVAGSSRDQIERALSAEFGVPDPALILDEILGPG
ncbi:MAG: hypothetical protein ACR2G3_07515 [Solirubrobacterales bacterium]